jgi:hypothetical protein
MIGRVLPMISFSDFVRASIIFWGLMIVCLIFQEDMPEIVPEQDEIQITPTGEEP